MHAMVTTRRMTLGVTTALCLLSTAVSGHEVWIAPAEYQVAPGVSTTAHILNGEAFDGTTIYFNPERTVRLDRVHKGTSTPIEGRLGDSPAVRLPTLPDGLHAIVYQSEPSTLLYKSWEKFAKFSAHKSFADIEARHTARELPREKFREVYTRFAKALIAVGSGEGADRPNGLETEIVALANPARTKETLLPVRVLYRGEPRADVQIEYFEKAPNNRVTITTHRTDARGEARLPIKPGYRYLVDAVVLREPSPVVAQEHEAVWETLWAALTFAVPN